MVRMLERKLPTERPAYVSSDVWDRLKLADIELGSGILREITKTYLHRCLHNSVTYSEIIAMHGSDVLEHIVGAGMMDALWDTGNGLHVLPLEELEIN
jgi:hypothetical protein